MTLYGYDLLLEIGVPRQLSKFELEALREAIVSFVENLPVEVPVPGITVLRIESKETL